MKKSWLWQKTVIITGAGSGFGKMLAEKLVKRFDCKVIGIGRTEKKLSDVKSALGDKFDYAVFDVGVEQNWMHFALKTEQSGVIPDILINNAGVLPHFCKFSLESGCEIEKVFATNFYASAYSFKHLFPLIKKSRTPAIINVSSSACLAQVTSTAAYSASKSALASFTKIIALENPDAYVCLVMPGFSDTNIFRDQNTGDKKQAALIKKVCASPDKITDKLLKKIERKKKRAVLGADAKAMHFFGKLFPSLTDKAIRAVLKKSGLEVFKDVF